MSIAEAYSRVRDTCCVHGSERDVRAQLREISRYLGTTDPIDLGAALLLEQAGYERTEIQLDLFAAAGKDGNDGGALVMARYGHPSVEKATERLLKLSEGAAATGRRATRAVGQ